MDESTDGGFPHFESYLPAGNDNKAATIWPQAHSRLNSFFDTRNIADEKLRPTGAVLPDAFARWWVRRWQSAFRNRTSITDEADFLAYCELGRELDRLFNLTSASDTPFGFDAEFTFYDQPFRRGTEQGQSHLYPFADSGHALEKTGCLTPRRYPFFSAEHLHLNSILYPRMGCKEFFEWAGFLARPGHLTAEQLDDLAHVGCSEVEMNGWCLRVSTETCGQFAEKFIEQLRNAIVRVSPSPVAIPPKLLFRDALTEVVRWVGIASNNPPAKRSKRTPRAEAEILVRNWLMKHAKENPAGITRDAVAAGTGVSGGLVSELASWIAFRERRDAQAKPGGRVVPLTDAVLAAVPSGCKMPDELAAAIEEQEKDKAEEDRTHRRPPNRRHAPS